MLFLLFYLIPPTCIRFILTYDSFSKDKWLNLLYWLSCINVVVVSVLQIAGIRDFIESLMGAHVLLVLIMAELLFQFVWLPFYQYYHSGATYRDSYYFLRAKGELSPESGSFVLDEEAEFSTGYDILAARLISVEMLLVHLSRRMERAAQGTETEAVPEKEHRWTNTKVAAILLVYGIHVTGSVDEGNAEIGELAALFEKHFHVDLGNVYHAFGRLRGQQNPTAFLDEMKERLLKKMRDMDSR